MSAAAVERKREITDLKKRRLLRAAEGVFSRHGLERTSLRAIAKAAGITAPAIYTYYRSKEELYGAIIARSLDELRLQLELLAAGGPSIESLRAMLFAYYAYYRDRPHQLDLGLYLFSGARPTGVTPKIDRELNARFKAGIEQIAGAYRAVFELSPEQADAAAAATAVHAIGIVIMSATKRLRSLRQDGDALMRAYIETALAAARRPSTSQRTALLRSG